MLGELLKRRGIKHNVLNAKLHEKEAEVVAQAGRSGAVTIATNMAGRGTDILLGGNPEVMAAELLHKRGTNVLEATPEQYAEALAEAERVCAEDKEKVLAAGGLHIVGTERHEARRIDNQLRGRAGRQGDPGAPASTCRSRTTSCAASPTTGCRASCARSASPTTPPSSRRW